MSENARRDQNFVTTLTAVSSVDGSSIVDVWADPTTHRLLVDLSGGIYPSSLALEIPSGTVNGSNTVFTVTNNPIFEEVSGQVMVSSVQDATNYGYVLTGSGPYTITFTNAPTQTPHSFYTAATAGSSLSSFFQTDLSTSTNGQTVITASLTPVFTLTLLVNGQPQTASVDYTLSGSTYTLTSAIPAGLPISLSYIHS